MPKELLESKEEEGKLSWKGLPYKGIVFDVEKGLEPVEASEVKIKVFHTDKSDDIREWTEIMNKVPTGEVRISCEDKQYDAENKCWIVLLRWIEYYYTHPKEVEKHAKASGKKVVDTKPS